METRLSKLKFAVHLSIVLLVDTAEAFTCGWPSFRKVQSFTKGFERKSMVQIGGSFLHAITVFKSITLSMTRDRGGGKMVYVSHHLLWHARRWATLVQTKLNQSTFFKLIHDIRFLTIWIHCHRKAATVWPNTCCLTKQSWGMRNFRFV